MKAIRTLLVYASSRRNQTLSYQLGWPRHFAKHPGFHCISLNVLDTGLWKSRQEHLWSKWGRYDAVVLLHSVYSNSCHLSERLVETLHKSSKPKAVFMGNEYKLMPEKLKLWEKIGVSLLVSQSDSPEIHSLYRQRLGCSVISMPNTGLDTELFHPAVPYSERPVDIGFRGRNGPFYLGHNERQEIVDYFLEHGPSAGLTLDISMDPQKLLTEKAWAEFLNRCKGQLGVEAGTSYFELTDEIRRRVNEYTGRNPQATFQDVFERFFAHYPNPLSGRMIASRHIEAAGTKTVQILFEGHYNGYLKPDLHYIPLKKDFSNFAEAIEKFRDREHCRRLTENAYDLVLGELTIEKLLERFYQALLPLL